MSYTDYITAPASEKIIIVEIDVSESSEFINFEPGIWFFTYHVDVGNATYNFGNGAFGYGNFGSAGIATLTNSNPTARINSFYATDEWYSKVTSLTTLRTTNKSFYYDTATSRIYIHFANHDPPWCFATKKLGVSHGYSDRAAYYDDIFYAGKVLSIPNITRSKDPLFFGRISFDGGTISLANADEEFDSFESDYEIYGSIARILLGFEDNTYADFKTMYEGYIENLHLSEGIFELDVNDKRKQLSRKLPTAVFDTTTYPNLKTENADKPIPLGYGDITNATVICTNEDGSTPWSFKICDTTNHPIYAINNVYVEGSTAKTLVAHDSEDLTNATFALTVGTYTAGSDSVTVDFQGYTTGGTIIANGGDIIRDILGNYFSKPFTSTFFNRTDWDYMQATTNLVSDPENLSTDNWTRASCTAVVSNYYIKGKRFTKITNIGANIGAVYQVFTDAWTTLTPSFSIILKKGNSANNTTYFAVWNVAQNTEGFFCVINWDNYPNNPGTPTIGTLYDYVWINSETLELKTVCNTLDNLNDDLWVLCYGSNNATDGEYTYTTAVQVEDHSSPTPYTATSRDAAASIGIHIDEPKEGWEIIEDISYSLGGNFIIQDDGLFTFRSYDSSRGIDQTIKYYELLQDLAVAYDTDEVLTSCRVGYDKNWAEDTYTTYLYNTTETAISDTFKMYRERTFDTLLTASGSATTYAENIMAISDDVRPIIVARTKMQSIDREISDMVNVEYKLENRDFVGTMSCEVIGKTVNLDDMTVELTLRKT